MHSVVTGRAFKRAMPIFSPQDSQTPYSPSSSRSRASWILKRSFRSGSRIRRVKSRLDSREARSVGSGKFSSSSIPSTVLPASERRSRMRRFRRRRKKITSFWFKTSDRTRFNSLFNNTKALSCKIVACPLSSSRTKEGLQTAWATCSSFLLNDQSRKAHDFGFRPLPGILGQARLGTGLAQKSRHIPAILGGHLRQQDSSVLAARYVEAIFSRLQGEGIVH